MLPIIADQDTENRMNDIVGMLGDEIQKKLVLLFDDEKRPDPGVQKFIICSANKVWESYCMIRFGISLSKLFESKYRMYYVSMNIKKDQLIINNREIELLELRNIIQNYQKAPTVAAQPIIYLHHRPRHTSELLYFDSPESLFSFVDVRNYRYEEEIGRENIYVEVIPTPSGVEVSDRSRAKMENGKRYRRSYSYKNYFPEKIYAKETGDSEKNVKPVLTLVDYQAFLMDEKIIKQGAAIFEKYISVLSICTDENDSIELDKEMIRYYPYLLSALCVNIETQSSKMLAAWETCKELDDDRARIKQISGYFRLAGSKVSSIFSLQNLQLFALWFNFLRVKGKVLLSSMAEQKELAQRTAQELGQILASTSSTLNLNLVLHDVSDEVIHSTIFPCLDRWYHQFYDTEREKPLYLDEEWSLDGKLYSPWNDNVYPVFLLRKIEHIPFYLGIRFPDMGGWADGQEKELILTEFLSDAL